MQKPWNARGPLKLFLSPTIKKCLFEIHLPVPKNDTRISLAASPEAKNQVSVWLTIPSARPPEEANPVLQKWRDMGYNIALWCDSRAQAEAKIADLRWYPGEYPGYAAAVNQLIEVLTVHLGSGPNPVQADWFVIGGDDTLPDPNKRADEIAAECGKHFLDLAWPKCWHWDAKYRTPEEALAAGAYAEQKPQALWGAPAADAYSTFGVMQPTGDRYAGGQIDRICGSAWIGREFAERMNQGRGPLWPEYTHMFVDNELQEVALKYGVLWQRPDLTQLHMQYCRESSAIDSPPIAARPPMHIQHDGYTPEHWVKYEKLFLERQAKGFPGSELK